MRDPAVKLSCLLKYWSPTKLVQGMNSLFDFHDCIGAFVLPNAAVSRNGKDFSFDCVNSSHVDSLVALIDSDRREIFVKN